MGLRLGKTTLVLAAVAGLCLALPALAGASHFRYGHYSWQPAGGNTINFALQGGFRRSANPCVDTATNSTVPCTGPGGGAGVGDVIVEFTGATTFDPGDSSGTIGSPLGPLYYVVTSIDPANDSLQGSALDPSSLPAIDPLVTHTYAATGDYVAFTSSCCRISSFDGTNSHINNADGPYRVETLVNVGTQGANGSPVSAMPTLVLCQINSLCSFAVPAADPNGDTISYRLSTDAEAAAPGFFVQPGPPHAPNAATINSATGLYTWDTTGATLGAGNTLYSTQVAIEDRNAAGAVKSKVAVDFMIQLVAALPGNPPVFDQPPTPTCGSTLSGNVGSALTFTVQASDPDTGAVVTLNAVGLPVGATMTPSLPTSGNPVSSVFSWTPSAAQQGAHVVTFTATDETGRQALCSFIIEVTEEEQRLDHFKCYRGNATAGNPAASANLALEDQFGRSQVTLAKLNDLCNPVDKNGEGIARPDAHLVGYKFQSISGTFPVRRVEATNQFGSVTLTVRRPSRLLAPSAKALTGDPGDPPELDYYLCYDVLSSSGFTQRSVRLADQFVTSEASVVKPKSLCNPVSKDGEEILSPDDHLVCYGIQDHRPRASWNVSVRNQFGLTRLRVDLTTDLCVPSAKRVIQ